jgi:nitroreductase
MTTAIPSRQQIERLLEAATYAPNHHNVQPWRFFVLTGEARRELGRLMSNTLARDLPETESEHAQAKLRKAENKFLRAPVIIIVVSTAPEHEKVLDIENVEATAAAVQNMLLVAEEMQLACIWRTKQAAYSPEVKHWLGITPQDHIVALLDLGYPAVPVRQIPSRSFADKTTWLD